MARSWTDEYWNIARVVLGTVLIVSTALLVFSIEWATFPSTRTPFWPNESHHGHDSHLASPPPAPLQPGAEIILHPEDHVLRQPQVIKHTWNVTSSRMSPDGVSKDIILVNGRFPGPTIEVRAGDVLEIEVWNHLEEDEEGISIHWHGLYMKGANHMDGASAITQCPIRPGSKFTYRFEIDPDQAGTFWYHAHSNVHRADGLYGGLVVHHPADKSNQSDLDLYGYEKDILLLAGDWYHSQARDILARFKDPLYHGAEPCPDSMLINGRGHFECSSAMRASPLECHAVPMPQLQIEKTERYRIRIVNVGTFTGITLTIPDSEIHLIQIDGGQDVLPSQATESVGVLYPGERIDLVVAWKDFVQGRSSELVISLDSENFQTPNLALTPTQSFPILPSPTPSARWVHTRIARVRGKDTNTATTTETLDLRAVAAPNLTQPFPTPMNFIVLYSAIQILSRQHGVPLGFLNRTTWRKQSSPSLPLLALERGDWDKHQLVAWTGSEPGWVDIVVNNLDSAGHPFHLHGADFYVLASWRGRQIMDYFNPWDKSRPAPGGEFNTLNPKRKDTVYVPPFGYVVLRFWAGNPGIWMFHCHYLWHQASGMAMAIQVLGDEETGFSNYSIGEASREYCSQDRRR